MSTYSKNIFDVLGDGEVPRPAPVKEEAAPVVIDKKNVAKVNKDAARAARTSKNSTTTKRQQPRRGRQFDRHSGTGIVDSQKKINKGWGKAGSAEAEGANDVKVDTESTEQEVAAPVQEEQEKVKTLDEYLAEKANKALKVNLPEARKANDNDDAAFKGAVAFEKKEVEEFYVSNKAPKKTAEKARKEKVFVNIEQRFEEKPREFRKNDRRGGRGANNNKNTRRSNKKSAAPAVNIQDTNAFPTLGATA